MKKKVLFFFTPKYPGNGFAETGARLYPVADTPSGEVEQGRNRLKMRLKPLSTIISSNIVLYFEENNMENSSRLIRHLTEGCFFHHRGPGVNFGPHRLKNNPTVKFTKTGFPWNPSKLFNILNIQYHAR